MKPPGLTFMTLIDRIRRLFSPTRLWSEGESPLIAMGGALGPLEVVIPRARCLHRKVAFPNVAPEQRGAALAIAAERLAPEAGAFWFARWQGEFAHIWVVSGDESETIDPSAMPIPESAMIPPPAGGSGERLVAMRVGVEGQVWNQGVLLASRWWAEVPSDSEWAGFLRSASLPVAPRPELQSSSLAPSPWGRSAQRLAWTPIQLERAWWRVVVMAIGLILGWQFVASAVWSVADIVQTHAIERLRRDAAPLIEARERAETANSRLAALAALSATPDDFVLIAEIRDRLPEADRLASWTRDGDRLRFEVKSTSNDPRVFVQLFREHPLFSGIVANPLEEGRMQLEVELPSMEVAR